MEAPSRRVYATGQLRPGEQFAFWRESICEAFAALDPIAEADAARAFPSLVEVDAFRGASLSLVQSQPQRVVRAAAQIRRDPRARLFVNVMLAGTSVVEQGGRRSVVRAGEVYVVDSAKPYVLEHPEPFRLLCLDIPRERLPAPVLAEARPAGRGRAALAMGLLRQLREEPAVLDADARDDALGVACGWLGTALAAGEPVPDRAALGLLDLWRRASRLIDARLRDPALTPQRLAAELHVSLRYLHKAFAQQGATVAGTVRTRRLEGCARELARPGQRRPVASIAQDWGFADVPNFHRRFRQHFGCTPGERRSG